MFTGGRVLPSAAPFNNGGAETVCIFPVLVRLDSAIGTQWALRGEEWGKAEGTQMSEAGGGE